MHLPIYYDSILEFQTAPLGMPEVMLFELYP